MAKYIPTKYQICHADMFLVQPAIKADDTKSVAKGECLQCGEEHEFTVLLNNEMEKES
jgi:hypothetical protein